jgi:hypothetical protein
VHLLVAVAAVLVRMRQELTMNSIMEEWVVSAVLEAHLAWPFGD